MIDQRIGNDHPPMLSGSSSPSPSLPASQDPINHPMKPITTDPRIPPLQLPVIACPMAPQIPTSSNKIRSVSSDITHSSFAKVESKIARSCLRQKYRRSVVFLRRLQVMVLFLAIS